MLRRLLRLIRGLSLAEWGQHPWRHGAVLLAVALGVALGFSVQLINTSALSEFSAAVRAANGDPDLTLVAAVREGFADDLIDALAVDEGVQVASPVVEIDTTARRAPGAAVQTLRVLGIDALRVASVAPSLMPRPAPGSERLAMLDPGLVFANPAALQRLQAAVGDSIELRTPQGWHRARIAGSVAVGGAPLVVLDIAIAQARFGFEGRLSRIDVRLIAGVSRADWQRARTWPAMVRVAGADDAQQRVSNLSRAYRVNLSVLALVALLVGGFLVYSVLALSVAQRTPTFALLGVLGLTPRDRRWLVLGEAALTGAAGSAIGLAAGTALAAVALRVLGGDLGGGYFPGVAPQLQWSAGAAALYAALGTGAAIAGAWWPARAAERLAPAQALKGLSSQGPARSRRMPGLLLLAGAALLATLPPISGLPLAAYLSIAALLAGGVALVPYAVQLLLARGAFQHKPMVLLAWQRARHQRHTASAAVAGVVASLALCVALTIMVTSFRGAVSTWLDTVLPADLYVRTAGSAATNEQTALPAGFAVLAAALPGVRQVRASRVRMVTIDPSRPPLALIARPLDDAIHSLPLLGDLRDAAAGETGVFVSEPAALIYGWSPGDRITLPLPAGDRSVVVRGVWRDYARQFGAVVIDEAAWRRHGGDTRINDLALWLSPQADAAAVVERLRALAGTDQVLEAASTSELRALSLAIFDRSFAVTRYLQVVAIVVGLIGVAASLSAQVLARRKEFGLLTHLGVTRTQILGVVCGEAAAWLAAGIAIGLALGVAVSVVLIHVVNPQSFHWTMDLLIPWGPLAALCAAMMVCGIATALLSARASVARDAVLAVKEDW
jgi:putative ABC transport system permease protein